MTEIVIAEAVRSAVGRGHKGSLSTKRPDELAADVIRGLLARVPQAKGKIDDVVLGCAMPEGEQGLNVARLIALLADGGVHVADHGRAAGFRDAQRLIEEVDDREAVVRALELHFGERGDDQ